MKITISYDEYRKEIIKEAHRLMVLEAIASGDKERRRIQERIRACEIQLDKLDSLRIRQKEETAAE